MVDCIVHQYLGGVHKSIPLLSCMSHWEMQKVIKYCFWSLIWGAMFWKQRKVNDKQWIACGKQLMTHFWSICLRAWWKNLEICEVFLELTLCCLDTNVKCLVRSSKWRRIISCICKCICKLFLIIIACSSLLLIPCYFLYVKQWQQRATARLKRWQQIFSLRLKS